MSEAKRPIVLGVATPVANPAAEHAIDNLVARFYEIGRAHPDLGPLFEAAIPDWEGHMRIVADFWSKALLGTERYGGNVFAAHQGLPIEPAHFGQWLEVFRQAANETLPQPLASAAISRAEHMTGSITVGLFPYRDAEGKPTRSPPFRKG